MPPPHPSQPHRERSQAAAASGGPAEPAPRGTGAGLYRRLPILCSAALLALYPLAWWAPLARAGFMPIFGGDEISILTGIAALWETDLLLCAVVLLFAVIAPYAKTLALLALQLGLVGRRVLPAIKLFGRLSMADVFLIAFYVVLVKGIGVGYVEIAWGLYLFTGLVLGALVLGWISDAGLRAHGDAHADEHWGAQSDAQADEHPEAHSGARPPNRDRA